VLVVWAVSLSAGALGKTAHLHPGGDPLLYGSAARDIIHNGPWMLHGKPMGQAQPFYHYPLYPYVLAVGYACVGEGLATIYLVNGLLLALVPVLFWEMGWKRLSSVAAGIGFSALIAFLGYYAAPIVTFEEAAFADFAFIPLVFVAILTFSRAIEAPGRSNLVLAGVCAAMGAAARPSLMTFIYLAPVVLWFGMTDAHPERRVRAALWMLAGVAIGLLPFTLRNVLAAGRFVVLVNSWIQVPYFLVPPEIAEKPGGIPGPLQAVAMAWDIFREYPIRTVWLTVRKLLYTLGVTAVGPAGILQANSLSVLTPLFIIAVLFRRIPRATMLALVAFVVSHVAAMVLAAPWTFHYKTILPLHAAFLFGAVFLIDRGSPAATVWARVGGGHQ
jgi:hypothetical protein